MTVLHKMTSLAISNKHLTVNEEYFNSATDHQRQRSERASSLALPHASLLDFYDKQQEQCSSVALLPTNVNVVVRRHSSHYYPMLEDKCEATAAGSTGGHHHCMGPYMVVAAPRQQPQPVTGMSSSLVSGSASVMGHCNYKANGDSSSDDGVRANEAQLHGPSARGNARQASATAADKDGPMTSVVNCKEAKYPSNSAVFVSGGAPPTPPPPIPKRTFRGKCSWSPGSTASPTASETQTPNKDKYHPAGGSAFVYPQLGGGSGGGVAFYEPSQQPQPQQPHSNEHAALFVDHLAARSLYSADAADGGLSDDDRMSLENSVFDESLTSTPVRLGGNSPQVSAAGGGGLTPAIGGAGNNKLVQSIFGSKTLSALVAAGHNEQLSSIAKRSNRSSSSTVDSTATTSSSSGYGSERCPSTSTTADFRSRFSSVDTQSSLDSCLTEKTTDSPPYRMDRSTLSDTSMHEYNNTLNNNEERTTVVGGGHIMHNNNGSLGRHSDSLGGMGQKLPAVPVRKQAPKQMAADGGDPGLGSRCNPPSTVSASTSTSSNASAGSGSTSTSTISCSNPTGTPTDPNKLVAEKRPPVPPAPPARLPGPMMPDIGGDVATRPPPPLTVRNKLNKNRPPPIVYPKLHQRQDSTLSSDSFSLTSSPGYNTKNLMDAPLLQNASRINKTAPGMAARQTGDPSDSFGMTASRYGYNVAGPVAPPPRNKFNYRQDSTISSDSFSQTSSPGYNTKIMEAPLLPSLSVKRLCSVPAPIVCKQKLQNETIEELEQTVPPSPLTKCVSTPASLQTIVRFQNGAPNTMSLQHQIINRRKSSNPYITNGRLKFRLFQILINAFALLAIAGGLAAYFNAYPTIKFVNKTIINTIHVEDTSMYGKNPAPGTCLPIIVKFCQGPHIPYNFTVFPNYIGHFGQVDVQADIEPFEALVDVRCYELVSLYLCTLFAPKCGPTGATVPPCKTLCTETMRRCGFFFDVFGLSLPDYLECKLFKDFESPDDCVGLDQVRDVMIAATNPKCDGFQCDQNRCLPKEYVCDGHLDCMDQMDEAKCERCEKDEIYCGSDRCISSKNICDGVMDCPYGQDERNCIRLSERNGDLGKGVLEVFRISNREWTPACVKNWDRSVSPSVVCSMLGYSSVNATSVVTQYTHRSLMASVNVSTDIWKMYAKKRSNLMQEFSDCKPEEDYPIAELTCTNYECGKVKTVRKKPSKRIIGGARAPPGTWPFLAAILGGPEKIFYCAGVLISDQWVLTASHCIGNHTVIDLEDWTIQLGVTRRNSFTYTGQKVKVKTVIPHPLYNTAVAHDNDIALFQLATRVSFHEHLLPVCLPPPGLKQLTPNQLCTVIGWGKREDKDPKSTYEPIVNEVQVPIIKRQQCDEWFDNLTVSDGMICAGYEEGGKDACQGDSGGPLLCPYPGEKDRWFVGGIVSWGIMCAHPKLPGVYANVLKYVPWIHEQIQKYSKPLSDDKISKYDVHPGGPDILSNMSTGPMKSKKLHYKNRPTNNDYYESNEK